jgi:hypothetical protein
VARKGTVVGGGGGDEEEDRWILALPMIPMSRRIQIQLKEGDEVGELDQKKGYRRRPTCLREESVLD